MANGVRTTNIENQVALSDELIVNRDGQTGVQTVDDFAVQMSQTDPLSKAVNAAKFEYSNFSDLVDHIVPGGAGTMHVARDTGRAFQEVEPSASGFSSDPANGYTSIATDGTKLQGRFLPEVVHMSYMDMDPDNQTDTAEVLRNAIAARRKIVVPPGWYKCKTPILTDDPVNIEGSGWTNKATRLTFDPDISDPDKYLLSLNQDTISLGNLSGSRLKDLHIVGPRVGSTTDGNHCSGLKIYNSGYFFPENVNIEGFIGSGIHVDKIQDSLLGSLSIQRCGRSTGDGLTNDDTTHPPINIVSTIVGDGPNMVRFNGWQIEANFVSPFVRIQKGIGLMVFQLHAEIRDSDDWYKYDLFEVQTGDVSFIDCNNDRFRNGLVFGGYGHVKIIGGRKFGPLDLSGVDGKTFSITAVGSSFGDATNPSPLPALKIIGGDGDTVKFTSCTLNGDVELTYGSGERNFIDCNVGGDFTVANTSAGHRGVKFENGYIAGNYSHAGNGPSKSTLIGTQVDGDVFFQSTDGRYKGNTVGGAETVTNASYMNEYIPSGTTVTYRTASPNAGTHTTGSICYNADYSTKSAMAWMRDNAAAWQFLQGPVPEYTDAQIADQTHAVNTGYRPKDWRVWDSVNHREMRSRGTGATAVWDAIDGSVSVTPS